MVHIPNISDIFYFACSRARTVAQVTPNWLTAREYEHSPNRIFFHRFYRYLALFILTLLAIVSKKSFNPKSHVPQTQLLRKSGS